MSTDRLPSAVLPTGLGGGPHTGAANGFATRRPGFGNYFVAAYPPFSQWSADAVADYRRALGRPIQTGSSSPMGLYVHIPFCVDRCRYCYYLSYGSGERRDLDRYVDALIDELNHYGCLPAVAGRQLGFVYFGGGTPSLLGRASLVRLFESLHKVLPWSPEGEITFECAPKSVTTAKMELLRRCGVTRLSLGIQQLDDEVLVRNGRIHLTADVEAAWSAIRTAGFPVVNVDLMVGLVGESRDSLVASLRRTVELAPDSITLYQMEIPLNTPLFRDLQAGRESVDVLADWDEKADRLALAFETLSAIGYEPISAYTLVRDRARHDFVYQREQYHGADLIGIGASAFGYLRGVHHQNEASLSRYVEDVETGRLPSYRAYRLDQDEQMVREFVLQLKLGGLSCEYFRRKFGVDVSKRFSTALRRHTESGWLVIDRDEVRLTPEGRPRVDLLIPDYYLPRHRDVRYS